MIYRMQEHPIFLGQFFLKIWEIHKEKDEARRCREEEERAKTEKVAAIAEKLAKTFTQEDLKILREIVNNSGGA